jgi:hypothetical protein
MVSVCRLSSTIRLGAVLLAAVTWQTRTDAQGSATAAAARAARERAADSVFHSDWANFARYREANAQLPTSRPGEQRVVFMGNSITEGWVKYWPSMFAGKPYVGRADHAADAGPVPRGRGGVAPGRGGDSGGHQRHRR